MAEPTDTTFDFEKFQTDKNAGDAAARTGKPVETVAPVVPAKAEEKTKPEGEEDDHSPRLSRSQRREMNRLRDEAAEFRGRASVLQEMIDKGAKPAEAKAAVAADDPEPQRKDFPDDAAYNRAAGRWDARQETKKELAKDREQRGNEQDFEGFKRTIAEMDKKALEDIKLFPDWEEVRAASAENDDAPTFDPKDQPTFVAMFASSDVKSHLLYYFAKNPDQFQKILDLGKKPTEQIAAFKRLEGRVETMYAVKEEPPKPEEKKPTAAELDAKKHKPSESVAARGGEGTDGNVPMLLEDGKTINPVWQERKNAMSGRRR
jgi:hypothetical protein